MHCLLKEGHDVKVIVRKDSDRRNIENLPIEVVEGDLRDVTSLKAAVKNCDNLFHVAADYRLWVPDPKTMYDINVTGTKDLILAAAEAGVSRMIYTSSVATLGLNSDGTPSNEDTPSNIETIAGHYKRSKFVAEQTVKQLIDNHQLPVVIVNPSTPIDRFAHEISQAIYQHIHNRLACRICFEPGRWICNDAMHIIIKVMDKKYDNLVITDAGTSALGWERFETDYFPVLNLTRPAMTEKECLILGSLCTPHDVWGYRYWGKDIQEGDLLMIPTQGAYTYSLRQEFIKAVPPVLSFP